MYPVAALWKERRLRGLAGNLEEGGVGPTVSQFGHCILEEVRVQCDYLFPLP